MSAVPVERKWPVTKCIECTLPAMEMCMLWWLLGISLPDLVSSDTVWKEMGIMPTSEKMQEKHLQWYSHVPQATPHAVAFITSPF